MAHSNSMPIQWHKDCLKNIASTVVRLQIERNNLDERIRRYEKEMEFLAEQIASAEAEGKETFDCERYKVKKN